MNVPLSVVVLGAITGIGYGLLSTGIVLVYRTNRIINFAHGEIGALGAALFGLMVSRAGAPYYLVLPLALLAIVLPALLLWLPAASFEQQRWAESDYSGGSGGDDEEEDE